MLKQVIFFCRQTHTLLMDQSKNILDNQSEHSRERGCHSNAPVTVADGFAFEEREGRKIRKSRASRT